MGLVFAMGCKPGNNVGAAVAPEKIAAEDAIDGDAGEATCHEVGRRADPLVVDMRADDRISFETSFSEGIAVVKYDCGGLELLRDCRAKGEYGFKGVTRKERLVRLTTRDEVAANLPVTGNQMAVELGASLDRGASLDLAMVMIGKLRSTQASLSRDMLEGERCDEATHFVRGATVGAVAMVQGTAGEVSSTAKVFSASASASSSAQSMFSNADGRLERCEGASPRDLAAPDQCGALIRLELKGVDERAAEPASPIEVDGPTCPDGLIYEDGKCTADTTGKARACSPSDAAACESACEAGEARSCEYWALELDRRPDAAAAAVEAHRRACTGGVQAGCHNLAFAQYTGKGVPADPTAALQGWITNCDAGFVQSCSGIGLMYAEGNGVAKDTATAAQFYELACTAGDMTFGCPFFAQLLAAGDGVPKDLERARMLAKRACELGSANGCAVGKRLP